MPRQCTVCSAVNVRAINAELATGTALSTVASKFPLSESALRRHAKNHLALAMWDPEQLDAVTPTDLIDRLSAALADVDRVRRQAVATGKGELVVKAATATRQLTETITARLGIDDLESARLLRDAEALGRAVGRLTRTHPAVGKAIAHELRKRSPKSIDADALEALAEANDRQEIRK